MLPTFSKHIILVFVIVVSTACSKISDDETDPSISRFEIDNTRLEVGDLLSVTVEVTDNEELNQLRLRMREAFSKNFGYWEFSQFENLNGLSYTGVFTFEVPDSALAGYYSISLQVVDERGNASIDSVQYISLIRGDQAPTLIDFSTQPEISLDGSITLSQSDTLIFSGMAYDADSLQSVEINILDVDGLSIQDLIYNLSNASNTFDFALSADSVFAATFVKTPSNLLLKVTDANGHMLRNEYPINFTP